MTVLTEPDVVSNMRWGQRSIAALVVSCAAGDCARHLAKKRDLCKPSSQMLLVYSCVLAVEGVAMSYFAFLCRAAVSATSFTVIGNVCKILTVLINISIWDKHASPLGLGALLIW